MRQATLGVGVEDQVNLPLLEEWLWHTSIGFFAQSTTRMPQGASTFFCDRKARSVLRNFGATSKTVADGFQSAAIPRESLMMKALPFRLRKLQSFGCAELSATDAGGLLPN